MLQLDARGVTSAQHPGQLAPGTQLLAARAMPGVRYGSIMLMLMRLVLGTVHACVAADGPGCMHAAGSSDAG